MRRSVADRLAEARDAARSEKLRPWLVSVAANEARQLVRRLHRDRVVPIDLADVRSEAMDPGTQSTDDALTTAIRRPTEDRMLIPPLRGWLDATEIGRTMGLSASGVQAV